MDAWMDGNSQTDRRTSYQTFCCRCFPSLPPSFSVFPPSLFQPIRHDSTSWLQANSQPGDISSCECRRGRGGRGWQHICLLKVCVLSSDSLCWDGSLWAPNGKACWFNVAETEPEWSESQVWAGLLGAGLRAIFNSYKDSCQHLLEAAVYSCGRLAFASLSDSPSTLKATYLPFLMCRCASWELCTLSFVPFTELLVIYRSV